MEVSVIIPVYNVERYIESCLDSVLKQQEVEFEIICIDDASKDMSADIIEKKTFTEKNVKLIRNETNHGQAFARNIGLSIAKGEYVYFLDADDELTDELALRRLTDLANQNAVSCVCFDSVIEYENNGLRKLLSNRECLTEDFSSGVYCGNDYFDRFFENPAFSVAVWRQFWKRKFLLDNELIFHEATSPHEDLLFTFQAFFLVDRVLYAKELLHKYRFRENSSSSGKIDIKRLKAYEMIYIESLRFMEANIRRKIQISKQAIRRYLRACLNPIYMNYAKMISNGGELCVANTDRVENIEEIYKDWIILHRFPLLERVFTTEEINKLNGREKRVIVYGAGNYSMQLQQMLWDFGITDYTVCVTKKKRNEKEITELKDLCTDAVILLAASAIYRDEMRETANSMGFYDIIELDNQ